MLKWIVEPPTPRPELFPPKCDRVFSVGDAVVGPIERLLRQLVGGEIVERSPERSGVEHDNREAFFSELARERRAACAGPDDQKIDRLGFGDIAASASSRPA